MSGIKISQLSAITACKDTDTLLMIQDGANKKVTLSTFLNSLNSNTTIRVNPNQNAVSTVVSGVSSQYLLNIDGVHNTIGIKVSSPDTAMDLDIAGHVKHGGIRCSSKEDTTSSSSSTLSINHELSLLNVYTGHQSFNLPAGYTNQIKNIVLNSLNDALTYAEVTCTSLVGASTGKIRFNAVGQGVTLQYVNSTWVCIGVNNMYLSGSTDPVTFS